MNTINIDNSNIVINENKTYLLEIKENMKLVINILIDVSCKLVLYSMNKNYDLIINMSHNSELVVNSINNNVSTNIEINLLENSSIIYNYSLLADIDSINNFRINHLEKGTKAEINNNGVNLSEHKLFLQVDGIIPKDCVNCFNNQYNKIINFKDGHSKIIPNFIIDNNDVCANHSAYIGNFSEEEMFYIKSRGISEKEMYQLLYRSLLLGKMNLEEEKELFNKLLKEWGVL